VFIVSMTLMRRRNISLMLLEKEGIMTIIRINRRNRIVAKIRRVLLRD